MSIVSKMLRCAVCYRWMAHLALIVVYIEFAWNYVRFNSNDYYFMRFTHLWKSQNYANKSLNYFAVGDSWFLVCPGVPHPHPPVMYNCCVSVFSKHMRGSTQQLNNWLARSAHADTLAPRPRGSLSRQYRWSLRLYHRSLRCYRDPWGGCVVAVSPIRQLEIVQLPMLIVVTH